MKFLTAIFSFICLTIAMMAPAHAAKKCSDFTTQSQAQAHYKKLKRANKTGWKSLDRNKDGVACECLKKKTCKKSKSKYSKKKTSKKTALKSSKGKTSKYSKKSTKTSKSSKYTKKSTSKTKKKTK